MKRTPPDIDDIALELAEKPNYRGITARLVGLFVWLVGWSQWAKDFNTKFHTVIGGVLYSPQGRGPSAGILAHERLHVVQARTHCCWQLRYLISSKARLRWECEAYALEVVLGHITREQAFKRVTHKAYWPLGKPWDVVTVRELDAAIDDYTKIIGVGF